MDPLQLLAGDRAQVDLVRSVVQSQRAERTLVTALDAARICAHQARRRVDPLAHMYTLPTPEAE